MNMMTDCCPDCLLSREGETCRLHIAAPDLLAALAALVAALEDPDTDAQTICPMIRDARAAIAKAGRI